MSKHDVSGKWAIDTTHSEIQFKIKHLVISTVTGNFNKFSGSVEASGDSFHGASVNFEAEVASVDTNNADRDNHLRSAEFFNAEQHPKLTFSGKLHHDKGDDYTLKGDLTMRGTTRQVELDAELGGIAKDPWGNTKVGFEIRGKLHRKGWGLTWNQALESGGVLVGEDVKLNLNIQLAKA